ncbi:MAG: isochorismatase family protein [Myxococcales bacterium]|nr:isochorismatase family protein [Myxococcota bacterium]MDW8283994.1 isochorismatase family protein [Myxococcales bacterium]
MSAMEPQDLSLHRDKALLLIIDMQERLAAAMPDEMMARARRYTGVLIEAARQLGLPIVLTEQYPRGLGPTLPEVRAALPPEIRPVEKVHFSCAAVPEVMRAIRDAGRRQILVCGMEAHVCVFQTVRDLQRAQLQTFVVQDAVASRAADNVSVGLRLMERAGAVVTSTETALFDLLGCAGTPEFKALAPLIR